MNEEHLSIIGRHEEKFDNLEKGLTEVRQDVKTGQEEIKSDLKELIASIKEMVEGQQIQANKRIDRLENGAILFLVTVAGVVGARVVQLLW